MLDLHGALSKAIQQQTVTFLRIKRGVPDIFTLPSLDTTLLLSCRYADDMQTNGTTTVSNGTFFR